MPLLTASNVAVAFGNNIVLDGATMSVEPGEKIGLVGRNGCGKTTLMKIICGVASADSGEIQRQRGSRVGYLSQDPDLDPDDTVRDAAEAAFEELHALHLKSHAVYEQMATAEGEALDRLMRQQARLDGEIEAAGGYAVDHKIDAMLHGLGFDDAQFGLKVSALSGGQKGRLGLARLLLEAPDLLLLDEPTNHLDLAGRQWLESFLSEEYSGAVLLVSHDRWLLDRVVTRIVDVDRGVCREYPGNYQKFIALRTERQLTDARDHDKQLDHIRREEQYIRRYKAGQRSRQAKGRESRLERFKDRQLVERPAELDVMRLQLPRAARSGDLVFSAEDISKAYGDLTLFKDLSMTVGRGDRIGIIGPNGVGKTTLIRCLLGDIPLDSGVVRIGSRISVGYYRQLHDDIDFSLCVWEYLQSVIAGLDGAARASEQQARDLAGAFLFSGGEQDRPLADLSGGERSRVVLAGLVGGAHNLLVLDEPSNHLDIPSAERLEQALSPESGYGGTLLLISHDRALLDATCDKLIVFGGDGSVRWFDGRYSDWVRRSEAAPSAAEPNEKPPPPRKPAARGPKKGPSSRHEKPEGKNPLTKLTVGRLEERIEQIEKEIADIDRQLVDPDVYRDGARCKDLQARRGELEQGLVPIEEEWSRRIEQG